MGTKYSLYPQKATQNRPMNSPAETIPRHTGHRERLRQRFSEGGADALADYELLELLLFTAIPRKDVKPLAKDLLAKFGSLRRIFAAPVYSLIEVNGISETTAIYLKSVHAIQNRMMKGELFDQPVLSNWSKLLDYCNSTMVEADIEYFRVFYLDRKNRLLSDEIHQSGTIDQAAVYPREILKKAITLNAVSIILAHNHPSGDPTPSQDDIDITHEIIQAAKPLGITIHDHLIIARTGYSSLRSMGLLV